MWVPSSNYASDIPKNRELDVVLALHFNHFWPVDFDYFSGYITALSINFKKSKVYTLPRKKQPAKLKDKYRKHGEDFKQKIEFKNKNHIFYDIESDTSFKNEKMQQVHQPFLLCVDVDIDIVDDGEKPNFKL